MEIAVKGDIGDGCWGSRGDSLSWGRWRRGWVGCGFSESWGEALEESLQLWREALGDLDVGSRRRHGVVMSSQKRDVSSILNHEGRVDGT